MSRLVSEIVKRVNDAVQSSAMGSSAQLRIVFHGPPLQYLRPVFEALVVDGGIEARLPSGERVTFPVVLQVDQLPAGAANPQVGESGVCDKSRFIDLRNTPSCPRFVALVPPGRHRDLSIDSTISECGLEADNNSGTARVEDWWRDEFIQDLVDSCLSRTAWNSEAQREQAKRLVEHAVTAADVVDRHDASRHRAWSVLSRVFAISDPGVPFGSLLSLACGYPPVADGSVRADEQIKVLEQLTGALEDVGFKPGIERLKLEADELDVAALDQCLQHLQRTCDVPTAFGRATPFYYGPVHGDSMIAPPEWWTRLTVEKWTELLEEERQPEGALVIECTNSIIPPSKGINALVLAGIELRVSLPEDEAGPVDATVTREVSGGKNRSEWSLRLPGGEAISDAAIPLHKSPARYTVQAAGLRKASVKIVSLQTWEPGVFVFCRTATKITAPKKSRASKENTAFEANLALSGQGRHYIDIYVRSGVTVGPVATGKDASGVEDGAMVSPVTSVSDQSYGFEVDATAECHYDLTINRGGECEEEVLRLHLTSDETSAEGCKTEFERLIRLNRQQERGRATTDVQIDRQVRCADLESWVLERGRVERSFFPLVLAPDYASRWGSPEWRGLTDTVFSQGRFLHDPRPTFEEMRAPEEFVKARVALAERIRQSDDSGLVESAPLGVWLSGEPQFGELIEEYVRAYLSWLDAEPDIAAWSDLVVVTGMEADGKTLVQEPDAVLLSPLHPLRLAWHCIAQRALYLAYKRHSPCPAASVLDPDSIPDALSLPIRTAAGAVRSQVYFAVECSSDYWAILWNGARLDRLVSRADQAPFDQEFGVRLGGVSSGFSVSQVQRALDDVSSMLSAKPVLNIVVSSAAGQNNACNEGLLAWCGDKFALSERDGQAGPSLGPRLIQVFDDRKASAKPEDSAISNLAEDTGNAVRWFGSVPAGVKPDLGIIAQLETSNASSDPIEVGSPVGIGALIRHRIRRQLKAGAGAFLSESRMGVARPPSGDGLADKVMSGIVRLENLGDVRMGYTFAPSVHAIETMLRVKLANFAAVSSSAVDPACFLGDWLESAYLWDYDLPSYSHRAGDSNGYYLLSQVKEIDRDTLRGVLSRLPGCDDLNNHAVDEVILEVARRGIPTVRGLSGGDSGASGDLGLFVAARLLQDEFRRSASSTSLLPVLVAGEGSHSLSIAVPVDPFRGYLEDLQRGVGKAQALRPDLIVACIVITDSSVRCKLTPIEVKFRGKEVMSVPSCKEALQQAQSMSALLNALRERAEQPDMLLWKLAFQHLLISMFSFGFRVYSQQSQVANQARDWSALHQRFVEAVLSEELQLEVDASGRLIVMDGSPTSVPRDIDEDGFKETIAISARDAAGIVKDVPTELYQAIRDAVGDWGFMPAGAPAVAAERSDKPSPSTLERLRSTEVEPQDGRIVTPDPSAMVEERSAASPAGVSVQPEKSADAVIAPSPPGGVESSTVPSNGIDVLVGSTVDGFRSEVKRLNLSDTNLNQLNIGVVGDLGTGKTQLLKSLVFQITQSTLANQGVRPRFLMFDYKKDYSADDFVKATGAKVIKPYRLPINLFDVSGAGDSMTPWLDRFRFFADVLDKIFSGIGPVQRGQLKQAVRQAYEECQPMGRQPTIYDVHAKYRAVLGNKADSPLSIIDDLVDMELFSPEPTTTATSEQFLDGVVVIALNALGQDDKTKNMLVAIMLNMFYEHMLRIPKRPYVGADPQLRVVDSFLLVDEADNIMRYEFDVLRKILLQGREFGVGVILASQYLRHFKAGSTDYREPLLTWFIHKVPNVTPQELGALGLPVDLVVPLAERVKTLAKHHCLYKTQSVSGDIVQGMPFYQLLAAQAAAARGA
jgi:DNA phosphorothioation-dependent restriction protein DptH